MREDDLRLADVMPRLGLAMTEQEFEEILSFGYELRGIEFKGPGERLDKHFFAKVVRAVLGMANRRNGGRVILGVDDDAGRLSPIGLDTSDLATWKYDHVADGLAAYADPSVTFDLEVVQYKGASYVVLHVAEFEEVPVLCKKDYPDVLRQGACYVRSRRKPETSEIPSQEDMRDLLEVATEKRLRRFISQAQAAGVDLSRARTTSHEELFDNELGDLK